MELLSARMSIPLRPATVKCKQLKGWTVLIRSFFDGSEFLYRLVKALSE